MLAGVGRNVFESDDAMTRRIVAAIGGGDYDRADDNDAATTWRGCSPSTPRSTGNDPVALAAIMSRRDGSPSR